VSRNKPTITLASWGDNGNANSEWIATGLHRLHGSQRVWLSQNSLSCPGARSVNAYTQTHVNHNSLALNDACQREAFLFLLFLSPSIGSGGSKDSMWHALSNIERVPAKSTTDFLREDSYIMPPNGAEMRTLA
jgi:hypothetical protein